MVHERSQRIAVAGLEGNGGAVAALHSAAASSQHGPHLRERATRHVASSVGELRRLRSPVSRIVGQGPIAAIGAVGRRRSARVAAWALCLLTLLVMGSAQAQLQRAFINSSFETPAAASPTPCNFIVGADALPGWATNVPQGSNFFCGAVTAATPGVTTGGSVEVWVLGANGTPNASVPPLAGSQHVELNAFVAGRMLQNVCLLNGDNVRISMGHRGRGNATTADVAEFNIDGAANTILQSSTTNNGTGGVIQCGGSTVAATNGPVNGAADGSIGAPVCSSATAASGWRRYQARFVWNGTSGTHNVGFEAISSAGGITIGNFLDDVSFSPPPIVEFAAANYSSREGQPVANVQVIVFGTVPAGGVPITITAGAASTATGGGDDYAFGTVTIPAGDYLSPTTLTLTGLLTVTNDTVIEDNETIVLTLADGTDYRAGSTTTCGAQGRTTSTYTILDNDVDLRTTKTVTNANPPPGGTTTFTVGFQNNTARPTIGTGPDLTVHDVAATLTDALPVGFTAFTWTCVSSGGAACPAASGTGAINVPAANLPAGNGGAAGGSLTYTVTGTLAIDQCAVATNVSTIALNGTQATEGPSAQPGFTTPVPGGTANNTAQVDVDPGCLTVNKVTQSDAGGPFNFTLTNTVQTTGTATTTAANAAQQVDGNAAAGMQAFAVATPATAITIDESSSPARYRLVSATCTANGVAVGTLAGTTYTIPAASVVAGADFVCTFNNDVRSNDLSITKTNTPAAGPRDQANDTVDAARSTIYTLVVTNNSTSAVAGAIVRDAPGTGITCPPGNAVSISGDGVPAGAFTVADLTSASGIVLGSLGAAQSATLSFTCQVN